MKKILLSLTAVLLCFGSAQAQQAETAPAPESTATPMATIKFTMPHAFETTAAQTTGAVFFNLTNNLGRPEKLLGAASEIAEKTELHEHVHEGDIMKMRKVEGGIALHEGETVALEAGGYHIMLIGLKAPLKAGEKFDVILDFEQTPDLTLPVEVISVKDIKEAE